MINPLRIGSELISLQTVRTAMNLRTSHKVRPEQSPACFCYSKDEEIGIVDLHSPFVVVPVIVGVFFACILWATRSNPDSHQPTESSAGHMRH